LTDDEYLQAMRRAAEIEIETLGEFRAASIEQHASAFKWLLASLLAINAGAAATIANSSTLAPSAKVYVCGFFIFGVGAALFSSFLSQRANIQVLKPVQKQIGYWVGVSVTGEQDAETAQQLADEYARSMRWAWLVPGFGWVASLAFLLGAIAAGFAMSASDQPTKAKAANVRSAEIGRPNDRAGG
jgi:hypothetical protein